MEKTPLPSRTPLSLALGIFPPPPSSPLSSQVRQGQASFQPNTGCRLEKTKPLTMKPFAFPSITNALAFAIIMSTRGLKRKSLTKGGAVCAFAVGFLSLACGLRGFLLLLFYVVSNKQWCTWVLFQSARSRSETFILCILW